MKLTQVFKQLQDILQGIEEVKLVTWWNRQDNKTIHAAPALFISFPDPLETETLNQQVQLAELNIRILLYSKLLENKDGSISEQAMIKHEAIAQKVYSVLHEQSFSNDEGNVINAMERNYYELDMDQNGWAVSIIGFSCVAYQQEEDAAYSPYPKPPINVQPR